MFDHAPGKYSPQSLNSQMIVLMEPLNFLRLMVLLFEYCITYLRFKVTGKEEVQQNF